MQETSANEFRKKLKAAVDNCINNHEVLRVKRRNGENFIVIGESEWRAIEETIYLNQFPGLVDSIHKAAAETTEKGTPLQEIEW